MSEPTAEALAPLFGRRSIRVYRHEAVPESYITLLLQAAMAAPSAVAKDPWRFIVIHNRHLLSRIADVLPHGKMLNAAPVGIVVCGDLESAHDHQLSYLLQDCSAAIENLLLAAHMLGLGACWLGVHPREDRIQSLSKMLFLPRTVIPVSAIAVGWPGEEKPARTRYQASYVHRESW